MASEPNLAPAALIQGHELAGGIAAIMVAGFAFIRWLLGLAGARQDERIRMLETKLEEERSRTESKLEEERSRMMAIAQVVMALIPLVEASYPDHHALHDARAVLKKAFPADAPNHPEH